MHTQRKNVNPKRLGGGGATIHPCTGGKAKNKGRTGKKKKKKDRGGGFFFVQEGGFFFEKKKKKGVTLHMRRRHRRGPYSVFCFGGKRAGSSDWKTNTKKNTRCKHRRGVGGGGGGLLQTGQL